MVSQCPYHLEIHSDHLDFNPPLPLRHFDTTYSLCLYSLSQPKGTVGVISSDNYFHQGRLLDPGSDKGFKDSA